MLHFKKAVQELAKYVIFFLINFELFAVNLQKMPQNEVLLYI